MPLFICYHNFVNNSYTLYLNVKSKTEKYNYRDIQKDSVRCLLIFMTINLKKYLLEIYQKPAKEVSPDDVRWTVITTTKVLKFGLNMLHATDVHIS